MHSKHYIKTSNRDGDYQPFTSMLLLLTQPQRMLKAIISENGDDEREIEAFLYSKEKWNLYLPLSLSTHTRWFQVPFITYLKRWIPIHRVWCWMTAKWIWNWWSPEMNLQKLYTYTANYIPRALEASLYLVWYLYILRILYIKPYPIRTD